MVTKLLINYIHCVKTLILIYLILLLNMIINKKRSLYQQEKNHLINSLSLINYRIEFLIRFGFVVLRVFKMIQEIIY